MVNVIVAPVSVEEVNGGAALTIAVRLSRVAKLGVDVVAWRPVKVVMGVVVRLIEREVSIVFALVIVDEMGYEPVPLPADVASHLIGGMSMQLLGVSETVEWFDCPSDESPLLSFGRLGRGGWLADGG